MREGMDWKPIHPLCFWENEENTEFVKGSKISHCERSEAI